MLFIFLTFFLQVLCSTHGFTQRQTHTHQFSSCFLASMPLPHCHLSPHCCLPKPEHLLVNYSQVHAQAFQTFPLNSLSSHKLDLNHPSATISLTPINIPSLQNVLKKTPNIYLLTPKCTKLKSKHCSHC